MNNKDDNFDKILNTYSDSDPRVLQIVGDIEKSIAGSKTNHRIGVVFAECRLKTERHFNNI